MKFQTILLTVFAIIGVVAVIVFATAKPKSSNSDVTGDAHGEVTIWGTFPDSSDLQQAFGDFNSNYQGKFSVKYVFHDPQTFDTDIVEGLASGKGPDILLLPDNLVLRHSDKIVPLPYSAAWSQQSFQANFIQGAEIYLREQGFLAVPFAIDPMVMYWNRDIFTNASIPQPPKNWDEFLTVAPKITKRDKDGNITQSAIAFGEYKNVTHAKDILAMLFLQVGNHIVDLDKGIPVSVLTGGVGGDQKIAADVVSAFRFFMDFSNPLKSIYSWSLSLPDSQSDFIAGNLGVYFGYASEYQTLHKKNPHLNLAVAPMPQVRNTASEITLGKVFGLAVMKSSTNRNTAFIAIRLLLDDKPESAFAAAFNLPPVRRNLLANRPNDAATAIFYDAALRSRTWLDPRPEGTDKAFSTMVNAVSSGQNTTDVAVTGLNVELKQLLSTYK